MQERRPPAGYGKLTHETSAPAPQGSCAREDRINLAGAMEQSRPNLRAWALHLFLLTLIKRCNHENIFSSRWSQIAVVT
jgi:hypothetical protein